MKMSASTIPLAHGAANEDWVLPYHGTVAMAALIVAESRSSLSLWLPISIT